MVRRAPASRPKRALVAITGGGHAPGSGRRDHGQPNQCGCHTPLTQSNRPHLNPGRFTLVLLIPNTHPLHSAIAFHVREIVQRSAVVRYLADRWSSLFRKPSLVVRAFAENIAMQAEVQALLEAERDSLDDLHKGKNNWNSIFVNGLLDPSVVAWLASRFATPGRVPDSPLG